MKYFLFCLHRIRNKINEAMKKSVVAPYFDPMTLSSNYKLGSLESNMIYESGSYLPKEVMLDMTLKAFGFEIDMMEVTILNHLSQVVLWGFSTF